MTKWVIVHIKRDDDAIFINISCIRTMLWEKLAAQTRINAGHEIFCRETPEEIIRKIDAMEKFV